MRTTDDRTPNQWLQASPEFAQLRSRLRRFVFPMTALFMIWYLGYVALATFAPQFMATPVAGNINVGILVGVLQFVSTFVITALYVRFARTKIDPIADGIRARVEGSH